MPQLSRIAIYPIKSLDGIEQQRAKVLPSGALENDRRFALIDSEGAYVNGKRHVPIHRIRAEFDDAISRVTLTVGDNSQSFSLLDERESLATWFGDVLDITCELVENNEAGFPDDTESPGPTVLGSDTLQAVSDWFPKLTVGETWRRLRANLEVSATEPFWEDRLVGTQQPRSFRVGNVTLRGNGVCQRCVVPTRDSHDGRAIANFAKQFSTEREKCLPNWSPRERFDHFYRVAINTSLASSDGDGIISVGDEVQLLDDEWFG